MILLFGVVSYKVRPPRLVSYACLYTTYILFCLFSRNHYLNHPSSKLTRKVQCNINVGWGLLKEVYYVTLSELELKVDQKFIRWIIISKKSQLNSSQRTSYDWLKKSALVLHGAVSDKGQNRSPTRCLLSLSLSKTLYAFELFTSISLTSLYRAMPIGFFYTLFPGCRIFYKKSSNSKMYNFSSFH